MKAFLSVALCLLALRAGAASGVETWREARPLMGTLVEIELRGADLERLKQAAGAAYAVMERLEAMMSRFQPESAVSEINRHAGLTPVAAPAELIEVLAMARRVSQASGGAFDVTIGALTSAWRLDEEGKSMPSAELIAKRRALVDYRGVRVDAGRGTVLLERRGMRLDLGGIAKLYIVHAGMRRLRGAGIASAMINAGGDIEASGGHLWRVGIRDPRRAGLLGVLELREGFVASSGDYERGFERDGRRYHHVLDPKTGWPTNDLAQVTLVGSRLEDINGYSAAVMALGYEQGKALVERLGVQALLVRKDGGKWSTGELNLLK